MSNLTDEDKEDIRKIVREELEAIEDEKSKKEITMLYYKNCALSHHMGCKPPIKPPWLK